MTEPYYNANLLPGFIIDLEFPLHPKGPWDTIDFSEDFGKFEESERFRLWLCKFMKGPYILKGATTAHWAMNVQLSHPHDVVWIRTHCPEAKKITENTLGYGPNRINKPQRVLDVSEVEINAQPFEGEIVFGKNVDQVWTKDWLSRHPMPMASELWRLRRERDIKSIETSILHQMNYRLKRLGINIDLNNI
jgi:hypothetical protein